MLYRREMQVELLRGFYSVVIAFVGRDDEIVTTLLSAADF